MFAVFSFKAKEAVVFVALVVTVFCKVVTVPCVAVLAVVTVAIFPSTYVFTAFCVGNNTSLVPKVTVVDLLAVFSFKANEAVVLAELVVTVFCNVVTVVCKAMLEVLIVAMFPSTYVFTAF